MQLQIPFPIPDNTPDIGHRDKILLIGSCFTENMSRRLSAGKFEILCNPHGILYNPDSIAKSLEDCLENRIYLEKDLFRQNEIYHQWYFHSDFSGETITETLGKINASLATGHDFLEQCDWLIITLGTAFQYYYRTGTKKYPVANCHKVPAVNFEKRLLPIEEMTSKLTNIIERIRERQPKLKVIFTISPVRHIRDGVIENNRSKARLLETVHQVVSMLPQTYYFPAYEIVIDVLRDYRFYENDWVHPNELAINIVWEQFCQYYFSGEIRLLLEKIAKIQTACRHQVRFPSSPEHIRFVQNINRQIATLTDKYPYLNFEKEQNSL